MKQFEAINKGYNNVFKPGQLSLGVVVPIENYSQSSVPTMKHHVERIQLAEQLGFKAVWVFILIVEGKDLIVRTKLFLSCIHALCGTKKAKVFIVGNHEVLNFAHDY